jgi:hypothetical protein
MNRPDLPTHDGALIANPLARQVPRLAGLFVLQKVMDVAAMAPREGAAGQPKT